MNDKDILHDFFLKMHLCEGSLFISIKVIRPLLSNILIPLIRQLLGEALAVVCLLSALIKGKGRLTIQFRGKGRLKLLLAQCDHLFNLRGLIQHEGDLSQSELLEAQQQGVLAIMIDSDLPNTNNIKYCCMAW